MGRFGKAAQQIEFLVHEFNKIVGRNWSTALGFLFGASFITIAVFRIDRCLFLLLGKPWVFLRALFSPIAFLIGPWTARGHCSIDYQAEIDRGLQILHPELGIFVTAQTIAGKNLILTGGNLIGSKRRNVKKGDIIIGDDVLLGANAVVLGPIKIDNNVKIGASSIAMNDIKPNDVVFGVPAKSLFTRKEIT